MTEHLDYFGTPLKVRDKVEYRYQTMPSKVVVDVGVIQKLEDVRCYEVMVLYANGVDSYCSNDQLIKAGTIFTREQVEKAIMDAYEAGISYEYNNISLGHIDDLKEAILKDLDK